VNTLEKFVKDGALDLDGIFAANLYSTSAVASALEDLEKGGVEGEREIRRLRHFEETGGRFAGRKNCALVAQDPEKMGYLAIQTLNKVVKKETVPRWWTGTVLVTKDNSPTIRGAQTRRPA